MSAELFRSSPSAPVLPGGTLPIYQRVGTRVYGFAPDYATPYVQNFNMSLTTNIRRNMSMDFRYVGTQSKKQSADINLNLNNIYFNQEFYGALDEARRGGDPLLLTQMLAGLTLGAGSTGIVGNTRWWRHADWRCGASSKHQLQRTISATEIIWPSLRPSPRR